jgi:hypothetical protein
VIHFEIAEEMALAILARAGCIGGKPAELGDEELGPTVIAAEVTCLFTRWRRFERLTEH